MFINSNKIRYISFLLKLLILLVIPNYAIANNVTISWEANTESDLFGYKIYYGISSRSYSSVIDVGNVLEYTINNLSIGQTYYIAVTAYDAALNESNYSEEISIIVTDQGIVVNQYELLQNYPNPFNASTEIPFIIPSQDHVTITIFDLFGIIVKEYELDVDYSGQYKIFWDSTSQDGIPVASGVYFYRLKTTNFQIIKKMTLLR